jgi:quinol monooxygenase YgiN
MILALCSSKVLLPNEDGAKLLLYELYQDAAAFDAHWNVASTARVREDARRMIVNIYVTKCALPE